MEKSVGINAFWLKIIAITGMIMQHTAIALADIVPYWLQWPLNAAGGLTFPIMAFLLVEGYKHTSNMTKYMIRLLIFGLVSQIPFMFMFQTNFQLNIMFTLLLGIFILKLYDRMQRRGLFALVFIGIMIASLAFNWGIFGPLLVFLYRLIKSEKARRAVPPVVSGGAQLVSGLLMLGVIALFSAPFFAAMPEFAELMDLYGTAASAAPMLIAFPLGMFGAIPLIRAYNGQRGRSVKYLFYAAYPLHLAILAMIAIVMGLNDFRLFGIFGLG
ncbi:MAG: conjugal transfer protein TraX [Oscillospiraceae bacterium]|nr:conjugal transfer protein TraX [Oscillospiraceae bacterium]